MTHQKVLIGGHHNVYIEASYAFLPQRLHASDHVLGKAQLLGIAAMSANLGNLGRAAPNGVGGVV